MEILKISNLEFTYPNKLEKTLKSVNFTVKEGEFIVICGESGSGKSTLLRQLKPQLNPYGLKSGEIYYYGKEINKYSSRETASEIGYVLQNPDAQLVTDKVWHELAFGLENMGIDSQTIRVRVAEMASFFGIQSWFRKSVAELSGGQKQLLNLASIMVMQPKILILDEPTSQLDPIAAKEFIEILARINRELSTTIILIEHNLEEVYHLADNVLVIQSGKVLCYDTPKNVVDFLCKENKNHRMFKALPTATKIYNELKSPVHINKKCPLTIKEGRSFINGIVDNPKIIEIESEKQIDNNKDVVVELKDVWFQYAKGLEPILRNVSLKIRKGEIYSILGGNGTGKTTTLSIISKLNKPLRGKVLINNKDINKYKNKCLYEENLTLLPQNPQSLFVFETLKEDLSEIGILGKLSKDEKESRITSISKELNISHLLNQHPYDLSGGEMQKAALAKIMLLNPKIILLDEPTKGLDAYAKEEIGELLLRLKNKGITIVIVTHDIEFAAIFSDRCGMFFDGSIVSEGTPKEFFCGNNFYTTSANRIVKNIFNNALSYKDVVQLCKMNTVKKEKLKHID